MILLHVILIHDPVPTIPRWFFGMARPQDPRQAEARVENRFKEPGLGEPGEKQKWTNEKSIGKP